MLSFVIPAKAGIHVFQLLFKMDASFRWHDTTSFGVCITSVNQIEIYFGAGKC
jgi:hypothetical protein